MDNPHTPKIKKLAFFGCIGKEKGHYWYSSEVHVKSELGNYPCIRLIDGTFVPHETSKQGIYKVSLIGDDLMIVAWHDFSVDQRPGSNCALLGKNYTDPEEMIDNAIKWFPNEMKRQPRPTKL